MCDLDGVLGQIPELEYRRTHGECPDCGTRFWNRRVGQQLSYVYHYLGHVIARLADDEEFTDGPVPEALIIDLCDRRRARALAGGLSQ
jgi:hypothetical protein